jgi:hypothetical protein
MRRSGKGLFNAYAVTSKDNATIWFTDPERVHSNGERSEWLSAYAAKPLRRDIAP